MGRNGTKPAIFPGMMKFINLNVGKKVKVIDLLLGQKPGRNTQTAYLYKFIKTGYVKVAESNGLVSDENAVYEIIKPFPPYYNSRMLMIEIKEASGLIPEIPKLENILNR